MLRSELVPVPDLVSVSDICDDSLSASFGYQGNESGYLSDEYPGEVVPAPCDLVTVTPGSELNLSLLVHSSDRSLAHQLLEVSVGSPYRVAALSPGTPITIGAGGNVTCSITVRVPSTPGDYDAPTAIALSR